MLKLKLQYFDHLKWRAYSFEKTLMLRKIEGRRGRGDRGEMVGWPHQLNGHEFEWTLRVGDGQGGLACCSPWGRKELDTTKRLNWTELKWPVHETLALLLTTVLGIWLKAQIFMKIKRIHGQCVAWKKIHVMCGQQRYKSLRAKSKLHHLLGLIFRIYSPLFPSSLLVWIENCLSHFKSNLCLALP